MRKLAFALAFILSSAIISPVSAASWTAAINSAISSGNYGQIDVVAATHPGDAGDISAYLLGQAQSDTSNPGKAIKILNAATPLAGQIPSGDTANATAALTALLALATSPDFQKSNPHGAAEIFADILNITAQPNIAGKSPHLHDVVLSDANDFLNNNPDLDDKKLKEDISLAQGNDFLHNNPDTATKRTKERDGPSAE